MIGERRELWRAHVHHSPNERNFAQLYRDPSIDVWLICWDNAQDTGYHDHDQSSGAVYVCDGLLCEDSLQRGPDGWIRERTIEHRAGEGFDVSRRLHPRRPPPGRGNTRELDPHLQPGALADGPLRVHGRRDHGPRLDHVRRRARRRLSYRARRVANAGSHATNRDSRSPAAQRSATIALRRSGVMRDVGTQVVSAASTTPSSFVTGTDAA